MLVLVNPTAKILLYVIPALKKKKPAKVAIRRFHIGVNIKVRGGKKSRCLKI